MTGARKILRTAKPGLRGNVPRIPTAATPVPAAAVSGALAALALATRAALDANNGETVDSGNPTGEDANATTEDGDAADSKEGDACAIIKGGRALRRPPLVRRVLRRLGRRLRVVRTIYRVPRFSFGGQGTGCKTAIHRTKVATSSARTRSLNPIQFRSSGREQFVMGAE